ncbi:MAG: ATP-dependent zinc metalloprotease FtsH [Desulfuromonadales bacterium]|nr:ATP-dependent zinc metalloprotease FtsH [Desulfuromonadales bacterium]
MNQFYKNLALWLVIALVMVMLFNMMTQQNTEQKPVPYSTFLAAVEEGAVTEVTIQGSNIEGMYDDGAAFKTYAPNDPELINHLRDKGVAIEAQPDEGSGLLMNILISWGPILLLIAVWIFFMRQMQSGGGKAMNFGKSRAKLLSESSAKITFSDVAGIDEAKDELEEVVSFLKDPKKFSRLGGRIPKGVLLVGPPGTGKTLLGRAIAGEAGVPFFSISGSDFVEMFVGVGASRVRDLFVQGKKNAPCIIFIDEIDAVGRHRGAGMGGGHDEREQTLNQLLVEMDGFESNEGVILIAATNRPDVLDPALLRPGRFDRQVVVPRPDVRGRSKILQVHARKVPLHDQVDLEVLAKGTPGFSGADLENLVNEAALLAARADKNEVSHEDLEKAKDKVMMGAERRSMVITEEEKKVTAYHEAGHALVAMYVPGADPVHKVSIIPRGRAMGVTMYLPEEEKYNETKSGLHVRICTLLGGRVAEELIFESVTSGASNDLERATAIARKMVCEWGMSDKLGPLCFGEKEGEVFLGRDYGHVKNYSEATAEAIDAEIREIVETNYTRTREVLTANKQALIDVSEALLERENMDGSEIKEMIFGPEQKADSAETPDVQETQEAPEPADAPPAAEATDASEQTDAPAPE